MKDMQVNLSDYIPVKKMPHNREKDLREACKDFESIFTYQLFKSMRATIDKCDLFHGGQGEEVYQSLLDQEYAKMMAGSGNNSISEALYRQLNNGHITRSGQISKTDLNRINDYRSLSWPLEAAISSEYGWRKDPFTGVEHFHHGVDFAAEEGTKIYAPLSGKVLRSEYQEGYGNLVEVDHGNGIITLYAHNKENMVETGDRIEKGSVLAVVGSTGRSTGPHLHFEVKRNGEKIDPLGVLRA
jgi:murein DD-endopeptidase MepM/ murein hydrolase activator NlpD